MITPTDLLLNHDAVPYRTNDGHIFAVIHRNGSVLWRDDPAQPTGPDTTGDKDTEVLPPVADEEQTEQPTNYEGFKSVASRAASRGQRVLPILVGAKNPVIKWKDSPIDTASWQEWEKLSPDWIDQLAAKYPNAAAAVIAKPDEYLFIDEDESKQFRERYEDFSGETFPRTFTTESRPDHRQSHWLQTDATRKLGNVTQSQLGFLSVRQHNYYVLSEGSPHPKGGFYRIVDDTPAIPMPDKMVEFIRLLQKEKAEQEGKDIKSAFDKGDSKVGKPDPIPSDRLDHYLYWYGFQLRQCGFREDLLAASLAEIALVRAGVDRDCDLLAAKLCKYPAAESIFDPTKRIPRGEHDDTLFKLASTLRDFGLEVDSMTEALEEVCQERCDDFGEDFQLMCGKCAASAHKYKPSDPVWINGVPSGFGQFNADADVQVDLDVEEFEHHIITDPVKAAEFIKSMEAQMAEANSAKKAEIKATWRSNFSAVGELEDKPIKMLIEGLLPAEGVIFIGALTGEAKTLLAMSITKALVTGRSFLNNPSWKVPEKTPVLHMIPETSDRAFRKRCLAFRLPNDPEMFLCRTISKGMPLKLDDPILLEAVRTMKPVVILDTLVRFNETSDEKDASANQKIANDLSRLLVEGAAAIIILHHATKAMRKEGVTLENVLRGTGDFAANAATVYGLRRDDVLYANGAGPLEIDVINLKPRDIDPPPMPFRVAASRKVKNTVIGETAVGVVSIINETGDFQLVEAAARLARLEGQIREAIKDNPAITESELMELTKQPVRKIRVAIKGLGLEKKKGPGTVWTPIEPDTIIEL